MAQHYNISIEDVQRICSGDGQSLRFVVGDLNNGGNGAQQIIYTVPQNNPQTLFPHQTINLATPLDQRQNVYIIKASETSGAQNIIKANTVTTHLVTDNVSFIEAKETKVNNVQEVQQTQWVNVQENKIGIESVLKQTTPLKQVKAQQQNVSTLLLQTQGHCSQPDSQVYGHMEKKNPRFYQNKGKNPGGVAQIITSPPGTPRHVAGDVNSATRFVSSPIVRARLSLPNDTNQMSRGMKAIQACTPIPRNAPPILQRAVGKSLNSADYETLSERIKRTQEKIKEAHSKQEQLQLEKQVIYRTTAKTPIITQRPAGVQRTPQFQQRQTNPRLQNPGTPRPMQNRMVTPNQQGAINTVRPEQRRIVLTSPQPSPRQRTPATPVRAPAPDNSVLNEQNLQLIQETNNVQEKGKMTQQTCTPKPEVDNNTSESYAYLQRVIADPHTAIVQQQITGNVAKMLVVLLDGEQRLITFDIPMEDCTVQDLLEQIRTNVPFGHSHVVSLVNDPTLGINYIVEVQPTESSNEQNDSISGSQESQKSPSPSLSHQCDENSNSSTSHIEESKYVDGMLAVCPYCGVLSSTFNQCERCKRKMPEDVKSVPDSCRVKTTKETPIFCDTFYNKKVEQPVLKNERIERENPPTRGRGRGRGGIRIKRPAKEPECLIISSDEEHENEKSAKLDDSANRIFMGIQEGMNTEDSDQILEKEPVITNQSATATDGIKGLERDPDDLIDESLNVPMKTSLSCRTVRIGSYKYIPAEHVTISHNGLRLRVPFLEDNKKLVTVDIKYQNIVSVLIHFGKGMPVLFFYTTTSTGSMLREVLGMQDPQGPYYDPASKDHTHKRITLLPDKISDDARAVLKTLYNGKLQELNGKEANDILVRASPKDCLQQTLAKRPSGISAASTNPNGTIQTITVYPPPPAKGGIAINTEDYLCLGEDQFLNDVIIDFYLKYLTSEILSEVDRNRTHVFSSYFYKRLTSPHASAAGDSNMPQTAAAKRHARVQKWTKNVNIFQKDFIVIPINEHAHWFLAIICYPGLVGKVLSKTASAKEKEAQKNLHKNKRLKEIKLQAVTIGNTTITPVTTTTTITIDQGDDGSERDEAEGDDEEMEMDSDDDEENEEEGGPAKQPKVAPPRPPQDKIEKLPCILIFDSLAGASRSRVVATLRDYLHCEHIAKEGSEKVFSKDTIKGACPKVPQQSNFTDCGVYVLQYVESFFEDPIKDYTLPIKTLKTWFEEIVVTRKREEISKLLIELMKKTTRVDKTINLPSVSFPTLDGKLKPKPETEKATKSEEGKKKAEAKTESITSTENSENQERMTEVMSKGSQLVGYSSTSSSSCGSTEGNSAELPTEVITPARSSAETMNYLKSKRIDRIVLKNENSDDKPAAKKLKSDNADSCK